jgi:hypothetical protein
MQASIHSQVLMRSRADEIAFAAEASRRRGAAADTPRRSQRRIGLAVGSLLGVPGWRRGRPAKVWAGRA